MVWINYTKGHINGLNKVHQKSYKWRDPNAQPSKLKQEIILLHISFVRKFDLFILFKSLNFFYLFEYFFSIELKYINIKRNDIDIIIDMTL